MKKLLIFFEILDKYISNPPSMMIREQTKVGFRVPERNQEVQNSPKRVPERNQEVQNSPKRVPERNQERNQ